MQSETNLRHVRAGALGGSSRREWEVWRERDASFKRRPSPSKVFSRLLKDILRGRSADEEAVAVDSAVLFCLVVSGSIVLVILLDGQEGLHIARTRELDNQAGAGTGR